MASKQSNIARSSMRFAAGTLLSRVTGMLRESAVAHVFGASAVYEAFLVAYRIPNLLRDMLAEGALGGAFTKVYSSVSHEDPEAGRRLLRDSLWLTLNIGIIVSALGMIFAPELVGLMTLMDGGQAQGPQFLADATALTRWMFPTILLSSLGAVAAGVLHQRGYFFWSALTPTTFNVANIFGAVVLGQWLRNTEPAWLQSAISDPGVAGLTFGVLGGGLLQLVWELGRIWRPVLKGSGRGLKLLPWSPEVRKVVLLMSPMVIAASAPQINTLINTNFATALGPGAVAWLNYAFRLWQLPVGLFSVAVGAAVLPALSRSLTASKKVITADVSREFQGAIELVLWLMMPCAVFLHANALEVVQLLYQQGRFSMHDSLATASALVAYNTGLLAYGLIKVFTSFYYALERTKFAMMVSMFGIAVNYIANIFLVQRFGHEGLALTSAITLTVNVLLLMLGLKGSGIAVAWRKLATTCGLLIVGAFAAWGCGQLLRSAWHPAEAAHKMDLAFFLAFQGVIVILVYGVLGMRRMGLGPKAAWAMVRRRARRSK